MVKRKVDDRVKALIDDVAHHKHRGLVLLVGDRAKDQVVSLHHMVSRANHDAKVSVLWCMREDVDFGSTGKKQQERRARLEVKGGLSTEASKEAFQTFLAQTNIRFCKYAETHKILGQTFGMAVLQDFEAINPNTLARTMETVKGGGLVVIMFRAMRSLRQLYTIAMDVHARYRTEAHRDVIPRFNERFLLSLTDCDTAMCVDDDLNVLPITPKMKAYGKSRKGDAYDADLAVQGRLQHEVDLAGVKEKLKPSADVGPLVQLCQTMDQAKTVLSLMQTVAEKRLDSTCVVTAGRGRGKSAALGMTVAGAVAQGYSNIMCTAPTPENVQTLFEFAIRGLKELGYRERVDFEALQGVSEEFAKCIIRISVLREHRQTVQFVSASDTAKFAQAEVLVIDEAAALPLTLVKRLLGPYLVILSSTVSGYEGTGRSLSMKLVADMRRASSGGGGSADARRLKELSMSDPIRYGPGDPVERWLNKLLCLDATMESAQLTTSPHPSACELFYVNRDALFSYHPLAEELLQRVQALLVAAHYKNQPNDLQLLSDAPGHHLFVLCAESIESAAAGRQRVPDILCVIHACEEGQVSAQSIKSHLSHGLRPSGDLIPYTLSQYYLEEGFAKLAGLRVVRIATNPALPRAGYGSRALALLHQYYSGTISLTAAEPKAAAAATSAVAPAPADGDGGDGEALSSSSLASVPAAAVLAPRAQVANLLTPLVERPYELIDYLGVSFGLTTELLNFWKKASYVPLYVRQAANELTGEHSCVMVRPMGVDVRLLQREFQHRLLSLLAMPFRHLPTELGLSLATDLEAHDALKLAAAVDSSDADRLIVRVDGVVQATYDDVAVVFTDGDMQRLRLVSTTFIEGGNVLDLLPALAKLYFSKRLFLCPDGTSGVVLSHAQAAVLLAVGLQCQTVESLAAQPTFSGVSPQQLRALFLKALSRLSEHLVALQKISKKQQQQQQQQQQQRPAGEVDGSGAAAGKRVRARSGVGADVAAGENGSDEVAEEMYDKHGNLVGLKVARKATAQVAVDTTLLRDTSSSVTGNASAASAGGDNLQDVFYRPKKKASRHR
ncbi:GNAT acetyltransferase 2 like protein [Novymonas esmeraldas]|uniref:RNA cytidine acetyltransferase n=1 Tax=Novymonas esmeraldas TaxID=1808958 RepID=A0AAW0EPY0_9TRYP